MSDVTLVILAWNQWALTRRCLESLRETDLGDASVIVVDNGSFDATPRELSRISWVRTLRLPKNLGYVRGNNAGIAACDPATDVVLLNNDMVFTQRDWLRRLRECAHSSPEIGIVGCRLTLSSGELLHAGTYILPDTVWGQQIGSLEKDIGQYSRTRTVQGIVFACAYLKREALQAIGGLSTDYESYFEDTDYCLRARTAGWRTVVCGDVTLVHDEHGSTRSRPGEFERIFFRSQKVFRQKWQSALQGRYRHAVLMQSILNRPNGYAMSCREILRGLDDLGVRAAYSYVYGPGTPFPLPEPANSGDYRLNVLAARDPGSPPPVSVVYGQGDVFRRNRGRYKVGYTMLEVDGFPADWVRQAQAMDEVWVPSEFNRQGFLESGLKRDVHVMPLGVDPNYFHPGIKRVPNPRGEFVFLSVFEWGERKDPWLLLRTFSESFRADEPVRLVCKIINRDPAIDVRREIRSLGLRESGGRISYLFNLEFPHYQLGMLYRSADCFVAASRGEGWDMPLHEAMACGLPAIATDWGAHQQFFHAGIGYPLRYRRLLPAVAKCPYYAGFRWAQPDGEHLRHLLREVYENRDEARRRGEAAAAEMASRWTWRHTAERIAARLAAISGEAPATSLGRELPVSLARQARD